MSSIPGSRGGQPVWSAMPIAGAAMRREKRTVRRRSMPTRRRSAQPVCTSSAGGQGPITMGMAHALVIEDDPAILQLVALTLEGRGYTTDQAMDGRYGLALAERRRPDVVLL